MENKSNTRNYQNNSKRAFIDPTGYSLKNEYLTIFLGDSLAFRVHQNFLKKALGIEFTPVSKEKPKKEVA